MHFVVGGAFNGKAKWVKQRYGQMCGHFDWRSAYSPSFEKTQFEEAAAFAPCTVLEGIEYYIKAKLAQCGSADRARALFNSQLDEWLNWEQAVEGRTLVVIGNDLSKGIVPIERADRMWRDVTGWCYQDLAKRAERVDLIWYGIANPLK